MDKKKKGFDFTGWSDHYDEVTIECVFGSQISKYLIISSRTRHSKRMAMTVVFSPANSWSLYLEEWMSLHLIKMTCHTSEIG